MVTAGKRRKIEEDRAEELQKKKEDALRKAKENVDGNEEAEEEPPQCIPPLKLKIPMPKKYTDVQTPKNVIGELVGGFEFLNFNFC